MKLCIPEGLPLYQTASKGKLYWITNVGSTTNMFYKKGHFYNKGRGLQVLRVVLTILEPALDNQEYR